MTTVSRPTLRDWLCEGEFTLAMSSGFFGFFAHVGALGVLEDEGFVPARLTGSSAGALVAGLWASGLDAPTLARELLALRREQFWDPWPGAGLLRGRLFREKLTATLAAKTFESCRRPLAISIFDVRSRATRVIERGELAPAIHASCALPLLFQPVRVEGRLSSDGGIADRPGLQGVKPSERVLYHHLASRSPWRRANDPALRVPARERMATVVLDGLPRPNPFRLEVGAQALAAAARGLREALGRPLLAGTVRL